MPGELDGTLAAAFTELRRAWRPVGRMAATTIRLLTVLGSVAVLWVLNWLLEVLGVEEEPPE